MSPAVVDVLIVEDSDVDYLALERALRRLRPELALARFDNGAEAIASLTAPDVLPPRLILLDLNLPGTDGRTVLSRLRYHAALATVPIVVLTTSSNPRDVEGCYAAGANGYLFKPVNFALFEATIRGAVDYWLAPGIRAGAEV